MVAGLLSKAFTAAPFSHCVSWLSTYTSLHPVLSMICEIVSETDSVRVCVPSLALIVSRYVPRGADWPGEIVRVDDPEADTVGGLNVYGMFDGRPINESVSVGEYPNAVVAIV